MLPDLGPKVGAFPQRPLFLRTSWTRGQHLGWWCPMSWGRRLAAQGSIREDSGYSARPRRASWALPAMEGWQDHCWSCPATSWSRLPQLWEPTGQPTLRAHGAIDQFFSSSFPSLSCLLYAKDIFLQSQCNVAFLFYIRLKSCISFFILYSFVCLYNVHSPSFCTLPSLGLSLAPNLGH